MNNNWNLSCLEQLLDRVDEAVQLTEKDENYSTLRTEIAALLEEIDCLGKPLAERVARHVSSYMEMAACLHSLEEQTAAQTRKEEETQEQIEELSDLLEEEKAKNETDHTNSGKPSSSREFPGAIPNNREKSGKKPGAQPDHQPQKRKFRENPDEVRICNPPRRVLRNPNVWVVTGNFKKKQFVELVTKEVVTEYIAYEYENVFTGKRIMSAFPAEAGKDDVNYGPIYKGTVLYLTHECNLPGRKVQQFLRDVSGGAACMSHGMIAQLAKKFSALTEDERERIRERANKAALAHVDTTVSRVNGERRAVNLMLTEDAAYYLATLHKGHEAWDQMPLADFTGVVCSDGETTFRGAGSARQLCLAHIIREPLGASEREPYRKWHKQMRDLLRKAVHDRKTGADREPEANAEPDEKSEASTESERAPEADAQPDGKSEAGAEPDGESEADAESNSKKKTERAVRQEWIVSIQTAYDAICDLAEREYQRPKKLNKLSKKGRALYRRLRKRKEDVLYFLEHPEVPYHNNDCERALRPIKRKGKAGVTWRSFESLECYADYLTVTRTAKLNGRNAFEILVEAFR